MSSSHSLRRSSWTTIAIDDMPFRAIGKANLGPSNAYALLLEPVDTNYATFTRLGVVEYNCKEVEKTTVGWSESCL
jgi:hypothetical protein